jgi:phosphoribosylamine--glycine ligase
MVKLQNLPTAKDYKRIGEETQDKNTGGSGFTSSLCRCGFDGKIETRIVKPTIDGFQKDGIRTKVLFL